MPRLSTRPARSPPHSPGALGEVTQSLGLRRGGTQAAETQPPSGTRCRRPLVDAGGRLLGAQEPPAQQATVEEVWEPWLPHLPRGLTPAGVARVPDVYGCWGMGLEAGVGAHLEQPPVTRGHSFFGTT